MVSAMSFVVISGFMISSSRIFRWCFERRGIFVRVPFIELVVWVGLCSR